MARDNKRENIEKSIGKGSRKQQFENNQKMRENYMQLRKEGKSNAEIATQFHVDISNLYKNLQKIADDNGVTRESLLDKDSNPKAKSASKVKSAPKRDSTLKSNSKQNTKPNLESERVREMKKHFMDLHNNGLSIQEIAERFNLNRSTAYNHLEEIAVANGVSRESLLRTIRNSVESSDSKTQIQSHTEKVNEKVDVIADVEAIKASFGKIQEHLTDLIKLVDLAIEKGAADEQ